MVRITITEEILSEKSKKEVAYGESNGHVTNDARVT